MSILTDENGNPVNTGSAFTTPVKATSKPATPYLFVRGTKPGEHIRNSELGGLSRPVFQPSKPRILIVTPEISHLPASMRSLTPKLVAKAGGLADVAALLLSALEEKNADVHVALPHYRRLFDVDPASWENNDWRDYKRKPSDGRIHLAEDRSFYYRDRIYDCHGNDNPRVALAFQRELINNIIPRVQPDIIHCHDWMTGLIPAAAKRLNIPCLFTVHNVHTERVCLSHMEDMGIDSAEFWHSLFYRHYPGSYEETRDHNPADLLVSGICASDIVNTVSPSFLDEMIEGQHDFVPEPVRRELGAKRSAGVADGLLNAPDPSYCPARDSALVQCYEPHSAAQGKAANKKAFQERTGLTVNPDAPLFFWPSRLDPVQKGCQLLSDILYEVVAGYSEKGLQIALVADGAFQEHFHHIADRHHLRDRVAVCNFDESLSRLGYAASDFTLMPSLFEPCGLAQMIAATYGSLPIVRSTGGLRDTVTHLTCETDSGNGFLFETFDRGGLRWAMDEAMTFISSDREWRSAQVSRVMRESARRFHPEMVVSRYLHLYERLANRCVV